MLDNRVPFMLLLRMSKPKLIERECKTHGHTSFILEGRGFYRCKACRQMHRTKARQRLKMKAVEFLGGKCRACGYSKCKDALHFNHIGKKTIEVATLIANYVSWSLIEKELKQCELLCANCHAEFTMQSNYACMKV